MSLELFNDLRRKFHAFSYEKFNIELTTEGVILHFEYQLQAPDEVISFQHKVLYENNFNWDESIISSPLFQNIVAHIGIVEGISYYKLACPKVFSIQPIGLVKEQLDFWKKLTYLGLGEFLYLNQIYDHTSLEDLVTFKAVGTFYGVENCQTQGQLIPIGGGKDSCVTLSLLEDMKATNQVFFMNPLESAVECACVAGYSKEQHRIARRVFDPKMIQMNQEGYLNGHIPFSAVLAFVASGIACLGRIQYIVLSNEDSSNETTVIGTDINHQYSKSLEFENDFRKYFATYISPDIEYFSLLRPWSEMKIAREFAKAKAFHSVFRSCNKGSKQNIWCGKCPKCLFVAAILSVYLDQQALNHIFHKDMLDDQTLEPILLELIGAAETKPFECVGTIEEVRYALAMTSKSYQPLPALLKLQTFDISLDTIHARLMSNNSENNVPIHFLPRVMIP